MAIILNLISLNVTRPINCQVGAMSCIRLVIHEPDGLRSQGLGHIQLCEQGLRRAPVSNEITLRVYSSSFVGLWLPGPFLFFTIDRAPYVSPSLLCFPIT